jgi:hypothetical protein
MHKNGGSLDFLNKSTYPDVFVFPGSPDYYYYTQIASCILLSLLGLAIIIKSKKIERSIISRSI